MRHRVDQTLEPSELRILGNGLEFPVGPQELKFAEHARNEFVGVLDNLGQRPTEASFFRDVETLTRLHLDAVIAQDTDSGLRHYCGRIPRE